MWPHSTNGTSRWSRDFTSSSQDERAPSALSLLGRQHVFHRHARLGGCDLRGGHVKWQHHLKLTSFSNHAADFDAAMMFFNDTKGKRETETCAIALGGIEGPENVWQVLRRDTTPSVADNHTGAIISRTDLDTNCARALHGLNGVQEQIQKHRGNLI